MKPFATTLRRHQQGNILLGIMGVMMVVMLLASTLVNRFAGSEGRAIEESLVKTQAYWAMIGALDLSLSTVRASGNDFANDAARIASLTTPFNSANATTWTYEDSADVFYGFSISAALVEQNVALNDGLIRITLQPGNPGSGVSGNLAPALSDFHNRADALQIDLCMGDLAITSRVGDGATSCQDPAPGDNTLTSIIDLRRI